MNRKEVFVTEEGYKKLKEELNYLKTTRRREIAEAIHIAKEQGDLSENAEYIEAKEEQNRLEDKISQLEVTFNNARVISNGHSKDVVQIGSVVTLKIGNNEVKYSIVGSNEANPSEGRISNESPLGRALIGKSKGSEAFLELPSGKVNYKIIEIE